jgi:AcrR family transcriptional regulator
MVVSSLRGIFVELVYHDGMTVPRQGEGGRIRQKQRTRAAIVAGAEELLAEGRTPTVAEAAERADVGRTTAYRYFPTQDALLMELVLNADVADLEELVSQEVPGDEAVARTLQLLASFNRRVFDEEVRYRTALRLYLDQWLATATVDDEPPVVREGRRRRWLTTTLAPRRGDVAPADFDRLVSALGVICGAEPMVALRDTARLDAATAQDVLAWAARVLIDATFGPGSAKEPRR